VLISTQRVKDNIGMLSHYDLKHLCPDCGLPAMNDSHIIHEQYGNTFCDNMGHMWECDCKLIGLYEWIGSYFPNKKTANTACGQCLHGVYDLNLKESDAPYIRDFSRLFSIDLICFHCGKIWWRI
jgi:hypothetical protein